MVLTTTNSTQGNLRTLEGTAQEVLDAVGAIPVWRRVGMGRDGSGAWWAVVRT